MIWNASYRKVQSEAKAVGAIAELPERRKDFKIVGEKCWKIFDSNRRTLNARGQ